MLRKGRSHILASLMAACMCMLSTSGCAPRETKRTQESPATRTTALSKAIPMPAEKQQITSSEMPPGSVAAPSSASVPADAEITVVAMQETAMAAAEQPMTATQEVQTPTSAVVALPAFVPVKSATGPVASDAGEMKPSGTQQTAQSSDVIEEFEPQPSSTGPGGPEAKKSSLQLPTFTPVASATGPVKKE